MVDVAESEHEAYGDTPVSALSVGASIPAVVHLPKPPPLVGRGKLSTPQARALVAAVRRVFADADCAHDQPHAVQRP